MLQQEAHVSTFRGEVFRYSPVATTFPIYYWTLDIITMTCAYDNIPAEKNDFSLHSQSLYLANHVCKQI